MTVRLSWKSRFFGLALILAPLLWMAAERRPLAPASDAAFVEITTQALPDSPIGSHGLAFTDVTEDGLPDLYITYLWESEPLPDRLLINLDGGRFREAADSLGVADFDGGSHGAVFADLDADGDMDLFNGSTLDTLGQPAANTLYLNDYRGHFTDITANRPAIANSFQATRSVAALDFDGDGDMDLVSVHDYLGTDDGPDQRNEAFLNQGALHFTAVEAGDWLAAPAGQGVTAIDLEGDGDTDLIAANRTGPLNVLINDGTGQFDLIDPSALGIDHRAGDGISAGDLDGDGRPDLVLVSSGKPGQAWLYCQTETGHFTLTQSWSSVPGYMAGLADLDNDGDLDLLFAGDDQVQVNDGTGVFSPGPTFTLGTMVDPRAIAFADIDGDGDLDFAVSDKRGIPRLVRNDWATGGSLKLSFRLTGQPLGGFGAKATVSLADGSAHHRFALSTTGYLAQNDPLLHLGTGAGWTHLVVRTPRGGRICRQSAGETQLDLVQEDALVRVHLFLEGGMTPSGRMRTTLRNEGWLDSRGPESWGDFTAARFDTSLVDWIRVDLVHPASDAVLATRAALLRADGWLIDPVAGDSLLAFAVPSGSYRLRVQHRNHLSVLTEGTVALLCHDPILVDLTQGGITVGSGLVALEGGTFALAAGDLDGDGSVLASDLAGLYQALQTDVAGYVTADLNLDGRIDEADLALLRSSMLAGRFTLAGGRR